MNVHRAFQTLRGSIGASTPFDGLYDPSIGSQTAISKEVTG